VDRDQYRVRCLYRGDAAWHRRAARFLSVPFEYLRVFSPSAEVKGHGGGEGALVLGKQKVGISGVEPVGNYALRLFFDDGHNTGLYSWSVLYQLGRDRATNWARYLERCAEAGADSKAPRP